MTIFRMASAVTIGFLTMVNPMAAEDLSPRLQALAATGKLTLQRDQDGRPQTAYFWSDDAAFMELCELTTLTDVDLANSKVTDEGFAAIRLLTGIRRLSFARTVVTGKGMRALESVPSLAACRCHHSLSPIGIARLRRQFVHGRPGGGIFRAARTARTAFGNW
jgi:hypothetical protein